MVYVEVPSCLILHILKEIRQLYLDTSLPINCLPRSFQSVSKELWDLKVVTSEKIGGLE
jgi:hypothetical protein